MKSSLVVTDKWKLVHNFIVVIISLWGLAVQDLKWKDTSLFEQGMIEIFAPLQRGTMSLKEKVSSVIDHYLLIVNTSKENVLLKKEVKTLEKEVFDLVEVRKENLRLKKMLEFGQEIERKKILAQVVSWDSSSEFKVLRINKGKKAGITTYAPVITMDGLVGHVLRMTDNYADILTILNTNNRVDAIIARTRGHAIVEGTLGFSCRLKYVVRNEKLKIGDGVITAGLGELYPKGIKIGEISQIDKESYGITQAITLKPAVNFHKLEEVVVLVPENKKDLL